MLSKNQARSLIITPTHTRTRARMWRKAETYQFETAQYASRCSYQTTLSAPQTIPTATTFIITNVFLTGCSRTRTVPAVEETIWPLNQYLDAFELFPLLLLPVVRYRVSVSVHDCMNTTLRIQSSSGITWIFPNLATARSGRASLIV